MSTLSSHRYTMKTHNPVDGEIFETIEKIDKNILKSIENQDTEEFMAYLEKSKVYLDGRIPLTIMLKVTATHPAHATVRPQHLLQVREVLSILPCH